MSGTGPIVTLSPRDYDAVLFDLDGVLTQTATVHAAAWKRLFDDFLREHAARSGEAFVPFDIEADYLQYVDGKPRYDGVAAFLASRGISLPLGDPEDGPDEQSVYGLGNRKDGYFNEHLRQHGVAPYLPAIELVRSLRKEDIRIAVVSSSNNCAAVLESVGITHLFDVRVDGTHLTRLGLKGKPAPDAFNEAARRLRVEPSRSVVVEDAISGVAAGRAGGFGLVVGVDRLAQSQALREAGAHVVVTSLDQVQLAAEPVSAWSLQYEDFNPAREGMRESLCALGTVEFQPALLSEPLADDAAMHQRVLADIERHEVETESLRAPQQALRERETRVAALVRPQAVGYELDVSETLRFLEERGFYVAQDSHSNYHRTAHSIASTFYMDYLDLLSDHPDLAGDNWQAVHRMLGDHRVARFLKARGYDFIQFGSWWTGTFRNPVADVNRPHGFSEFNMLYLRRTMLRPIFHALPDRPLTMRLDWDNAQCQRLALQIEHVQQVIDRVGQGCVVHPAEPSCWTHPRQRWSLRWIPGWTAGAPARQPG